LREDFVSTWSKADACIYKPFDLEALVEKIEAIVGSSVGDRAQS
jgi:DNA-binding response OmpR family regulator